MGFFSKLKQNFTHGGVKVQLEAPATVSQQDPNFVSSVTVTNGGDSPQTINVVKVSLIENKIQPERSGQSASGAGDLFRELSKAEESRQFILNPAESRHFTITVPMNFGKYISEQSQDNGLISGIASALGTIQTVADAMDPSHYDYFIEAKVDVEGITFDPSDKSRVQLLKPGQIGTSINIGI